jgi:hypothetical protein
MFKGTVSLDFLLQAFLWIIFLRVPESNIRVISNLSENSEIFSSHCMPPVSTTLVPNFTTGTACVQILPLAPLVSTVPIENCHRFP